MRPFKRSILWLCAMLILAGCWGSPSSASSTVMSGPTATLIGPTETATSPVPGSTATALPVLNPTPTVGQWVPPTPTPTPIANLPLRLVISANPYRYQLLSSNGQLIVAQHDTEFDLGNEHDVVTSAMNIQSNGTTMDADLRLAPSGRTAHAHFSFINPAVVRVQLTLSGNPPNAITEAVADQGDHYYGLFEYPFTGKLDARGTDQDLLGRGSNGNTVNASDARAPYLMSSRGYAIYVESQTNGHVTVGINGRTAFAFPGSQMTYDLIDGPDYRAMLARYTAIAGGAYMPPLWAFDSIWWKDDDHVNFHDSVSNAQQNVVDTAIQLQNNQIPAGAEWVDRPYGTGNQGWGNFDFDSSFPNPQQMVNDVRAHGLHLMLWIANRAWNNLYNTGNARGYLFAGDANLGPAFNLNNTQAYQWLLQQYSAFTNLGIQGYKIDRGEEGEQPDYAQNQNITLFAQLAADSLAAKGGNGFIFARNAYDTGRKYTALWNGDTYSSFGGLSMSVLTALNSGMIAFPMWGSDTGGYVPGSNGNGMPGKELFARWLEFSAYSPIMEVLIGNGRTPWYDYDSQLLAIARSQATLHHDLIPYTRSVMYQATQSGMPVMRALVLAYPNDPQVTNIADEYLFGPNLLVAPVLTQGATSRAVYLPAGKWLNETDKTISTGGQTITAQAPLDTIPVFAPEGAIIPRGDIVQANNNWTPNWSPRLDIEILPARLLASTFDYDTGSAIAQIIVLPGNGTITVHTDDLGVPGTLEIAVKGLSAVVRNGQTLVNGQDYTYEPGSHLLRIPFAGATTLTLQGATSIFA